MNSDTALEVSKEDARLKAQADRFLVDSLKILKDLETERLRNHEKAVERRSIISEVKDILRGKV